MKCWGRVFEYMEKKEEKPKKSLISGFHLVLIIGLFLTFLFYFSIPNQTKTANYSGDFLFHYEKAAGLKDPLTGIGGQKVNIDTLESYPPAYSWISGLFSYRPEIFLLFSLLLFFLIFPLVLYFKVGAGVVSLFWFAFSAPYFFVLGPLSQGLATLFFIFFVFTENKIARLLLLFFGLLIHSYAFWLFAAFWFFEIIINLDWKKMFLGVCSFFIPKGNNFVAEISEATGTNSFGGPGLLGTSFEIIVRWFIFNPLLIFSFIGLRQLKNKALFYFPIFIMLFSLFFLWWRVVACMAPLFAIGVATYYKNVSWKMKVGLIVAALFLVVLHYAHYLSLLRLIGFSLHGGLKCSIHLISGGVLFG